MTCSKPPSWRSPKNPFNLALTPSPSLSPYPHPYGSMKKTLTKTFFATVQFILGFILGVVILGAGAAGAGYYILNRMANLPAKPLFSEENEDSPAATESDRPAAESTDTAVAPTPAENPPAATPPAATPDTATEDPKPEPKATPEAEAETPEPLGANEYYGKVTWETGLVLRGAPSTSAGRIGGVAYNAEVVVIEKSSDGNWEKIRVVSTNQEAWVKAGNIRQTPQ